VLKRQYLCLAREGRIRRRIGILNGLILKEKSGFGAAKNTMNKLLLLLALILLLFCAGCGAGSSSSSGGFGGGGTSGSFSNANLKGNYAYEIVGIDITDNVPFREEGAFVADGSGNVTSGEDDFAEGSSLVHNVVTATTSGAAYSVSSDGTALLNLGFSNGGGLQVALSVVSSPTVYLAVTEVEPLTNILQVNGTGFAVPQTTSAFSAPSGTFVFRTQTLATVLGGLQPIANVGVFTVASGAVSAGNEDQLIFGAADSQLTLTSGVFNAPDSLGRGTGTLTDSNAVTSSFYYYMVDSNHLHFFSSTPGTIGVGRAVAQTSTSFPGSYVFGSKGDDSVSLGGVNTVGQFTASGGAISGGQFDSVQDSGSPVSGTFTAGSYTAASNGRAVVSLTPSVGNPISEIYWVVSPSLAFFVTNDATKVEAGTATVQSTTSFTKSSVSGTFGFAMDGFNTTDLYDRVGNLHWDGAGNLGLTEVVNLSGSPSTSGTLMGTYAVASNGRAVGNISGLSSNLVIYLASSSEGYMLQGDSGVEINGMMGTAP